MWGLTILTTIISNKIFLLKDTSPCLPSFREIVIFVAISAVALLTFNEQEEWFSVHGMDSALYSIIAGSIIHEGGIVTEKQLFSEKVDQLTTKKPRFFTHDAEDKNTSIAPFMHLYPSVLAFYRGHIGLANSYSLNWLLGILAAFIFYLLISNATNSETIGAIGGILLFTNPACQMYFYRNMTEILSIILFCSAALFAYYLYKYQKKFFSIPIAIALLLLGGCRLEFVIFFVLVPLIFTVPAFLNPTQRSKGAALLTACLVLFPVMVAYQQLFAYRYGEGIASDVAKFEALGAEYGTYMQTVHILNAAALLIAIIYLYLSKYFEKPLEAFYDFALKYFPKLIAIIFACYLFYSFSLRPLTASVDLSDGRWHDPFNFVRLTYWVDLVVIILSPIGLMKLLRKEATLPIGLVYAFFIMVVLIKSGHSAPLMWWVRRYVPVVIPGFYILALASFTNLSSKRLLPLLAISLCFNLWIDYKSIWNHSSRQGYVKYYNRLAHRLKPNSIILCADVDRACTHSALNLVTHFGFKAGYLKEKVNQESLKDLTEFAGGTKDPVYLLTASLRDGSYVEEISANLDKLGVEHRISTLDPDFTIARRVYNKEWKPGEPYRKLYYPPTFYKPALARMHIRSITLIRINPPKKKT